MPPFPTRTLIPITEDPVPPLEVIGFAVLAGVAPLLVAAATATRIAALRNGGRSDGSPPAAASTVSLH